MKKFILAIILSSLMSLVANAAPPAFYTALTNGPPFIALLAESGADLISIVNTDVGDCPGCYGFEVSVIYPDGSDDVWFFLTALAPTGQIVVTLIPEGPPGDFCK